MSTKTQKHHHSEIHINLDSARADLKPLLDELNPILRRVLDALEKFPDETSVPHSAGYHNVTRCKHDDCD
jgi:hypothetical protein